MAPSPGRPSLSERLAEPRPLVIDGGLATELEARGYDLDDPLWSARLLLEDPDVVRAVHADYVQAGAELVIAATYQASFAGLAARGIGREDAKELLRGAVQLARDCGAPYVAASVGPYGAALANGSEYTGDYPASMDAAALEAWHAERYAVLASSGADLLACETIPNRHEAEALVSLAREHPGTPVWFSFSCRDGLSLRDGSSLRAVAELCATVPSALAIGVNCTAPKHVDGLIGELRAASSLPVLVYPNSGESYDVATHTWHGERDPEAFGLCAARWRELGASLLGGCCRTGPEHVRSLGRLR